MTTDSGVEGCVLHISPQGSVGTDNHADGLVKPPAESVSMEHGPRLRSEVLSKKSVMRGKPLIISFISFLTLSSGELSSSTTKEKAESMVCKLLLFTGLVSMVARIFAQRDLGRLVKFCTPCSSRTALQDKHTHKLI